MAGQDDGEEEGTRRYPRKELIFSSLPYAHALTLQVFINFFLFSFWLTICPSKGQF